MGYSYVRAIPRTMETDVLVIGGGPAGFSAAVSCAKMGVSVTLVEQFGFPGGMATAGLVGPFMTSYDANGERQIIQGVFDELVRELEVKGGAIHPSKVSRGSSYSGFITKGHSNVAPFDPELMKVTMVEFLERFRVNLLFHTRVIDVVKEGEEIVEAIIHNKSGLSSIKASVMIDCTGDADVAVLAGCPFSLGRVSDQLMQPATMFFRVCNVDSQKVKAYVEKHRDKIGKPFHGPFSWVVEKAREQGEWSIERSEIGMYETSTEGIWRINTSRVTNVDGTNAEDLTRAEIEGRKQVQTLLAFLKKHIPGYENAQLMETATTIGIRETRHVIGEYVITKEDVLNAVSFDDAIMIASNSIDIHSDKEGGGEYASIRGDWYSIPYRALLPLKTSNLLVAGRPISATSEASAAFRVMPCCMAMGQAAGVAAALGVSNSIALREVDIAILQETLKRQGVVLE